MCVIFCKIDDLFIESNAPGWGLYLTKKKHIYKIDTLEKIM